MVAAGRFVTTWLVCRLRLAPVVCPGGLPGCPVVTCSSTSRKPSIQICAAVGADALVNYGGDNLKTLKAQVSEITGGHFADVIYEICGGDVFTQAARCIASEGRLLVIGFASGTIPSIKVNLPLVKGTREVIDAWCNVGLPRGASGTRSQQPITNAMV